MHLFGSRNYILLKRSILSYVNESLVLHFRKQCMLKMKNLLPLGNWLILIKVFFCLNILIRLSLIHFFWLETCVEINEGVVAPILWHQSIPISTFWSYLEKKRVEVNYNLIPRLPDKFLRWNSPTTNSTVLSKLVSAVAILMRWPLHLIYMQPSMPVIA